MCLSLEIWLNFIDFCSLSQLSLFFTHSVCLIWTCTLCCREGVPRTLGCLIHWRRASFGRPFCRWYWLKVGGCFWTARQVICLFASNWESSSLKARWFPLLLILLYVFCFSPAHLNLCLIFFKPLSASAQATDVHRLHTKSFKYYVFSRESWLTLNGSYLINTRTKTKHTITNCSFDVSWSRSGCFCLPFMFSFYSESLQSGQSSVERKIHHEAFPECCTDPGGGAVVQRIPQEWGALGDVSDSSSLSLWAYFLALLLVLINKFLKVFITPPFLQYL